MAAISDIMLFGLQLSLDLPRDGEVSLREPQGRELVESVEPYCRGVAGSHYNPRTTTIPPRHLGDALGRNSEHSPREIAVRRVFKVLTEEIISRGESRHSSTWVLWYEANRSLLRPDVH